MRFQGAIEALFWRDVYAASVNNGDDNDTAAEYADEALTDYRERI